MSAGAHLGLKPAIVKAKQGLLHQAARDFVEAQEAYVKGAVLMSAILDARTALQAAALELVKAERLDRNAERRLEAKRRKEAREAGE